MKKSQQVTVNYEVYFAHSDLMMCIDFFGANKVSKLRTCKAEVYRTDGYIFLKSYNTIVAAIGENDCICYDFLRMVYGYTATSAQHIAKFMQDYNCTCKKTYYPV